MQLSVVILSEKWEDDSLKIFQGVFMYFLLYIFVLGEGGASAPRAHPLDPPL